MRRIPRKCKFTYFIICFVSLSTAGFLKISKTIPAELLYTKFKEVVSLNIEYLMFSLSYLLTSMKILSYHFNIIYNALIIDVTDVN